MLDTYDSLGYVYFPIHFQPHHDDKKKDGVNKGVRFPKGWSSTTVSSRGQNVAILTGKVSGITVVDFDEMESYRACCERVPELEYYYTVRTKNGVHVYFTYQEGLVNDSDCFTLPGIDIRNDGGCIVAPPSSYSFEDATYRYEVMTNGAVEEMPEGLLEMVKVKGKKDSGVVPISRTGMIDMMNDQFKTTFALLDLLSVDRATQYGSWSHVGFALHQSQGPMGEEFFHYFSKKSYKYNASKVSEWFSTIKTRHGGFTERSLHYWAKQDSPAEYAEMFGISPRRLLQNGDNINHADTAKCYDSITAQKFVYSNKCWYKYDVTNLVIKLGKESPDALRSSISDTLQREIKKVLNDMPHNDEHYKDTAKKALKCHKTLGTNTFINGTIDYLRTIYTDNTFSQLIDANTNLLAFADGSVMDYERKMIRPVERWDYVMKTTRRTLNEESSTALRQWLHAELLNIFDTEEVVRYWKEHIAMSLFCNSFEKFYCHTGTGGNGKGILFTLLGEALGDYYLQADNEFLTSTYKSGAPNPTLARAKGVRVFVTSEPSSEASDGGKMKLSVELIKALTGRDPINVRTLYEEGSEWIPTFTSFLLCNLIPEMTKVDGGIRRRFVKMDYPNTFSENPKDGQKKADVQLKEKMTRPEIVNEFLLMMWETACGFTEFHYPESVLKSTEKCLDDEDKVRVWIREYMETMKELPRKMKGEEDTRITKAEAHTMFKRDMKTGMGAKAFHYQMREELKIEVSASKGKEFYLIRRREDEE